MKNKDNYAELKAYELLGIKLFRKLAFGLRNILSIPFILFKSKEEREKFFKNLNYYPSNYNMKKGNGIKDLKDFKIMLLMNSLIHIAAQELITIFIINTIITGNISLDSIINNTIVTYINLYSIMLQRYNWIRINKAIKRFSSVDEIKKNKLRVELKERDKKLQNHDYKIINYRLFTKKLKVYEIDFDELINRLDISELKKCLFLLNKVLEGINNKDFELDNERYTKSLNSKEVLCLNLNKKNE